MGDLASLNSAQREAVLATEGPLLILAGAGAGKTRVITERIKQIVRRGVAPEEILAITFTNKAAGEMRERIPPGPFISTFHSLGLFLIKENYKLLGLKRRPVLYDRSDSLREMKRALKETGAEDFEARSILAAASRQKGEGITAEEFATSAASVWERAVAAAWRYYEAALKRDGALDFDDLLLRAVELLEQHPQVREACLRRWRYIHIDEYQDTNLIQARLADLLVGKERNIAAVGDIDQTIYTWRGAQIVNLLKFEERYPGTKIILLEQNYRSTKAILAAANEIIAKNVYRREKNLYTENRDGEPLSLYIAFDETDEAGFIARKIQELCRGPSSVRTEDGPLQPRDFAVLYRANFQSRAIEEQLLAAGIPYQVVGTRFFERREVKDALAWVRAAQGGVPADVARAAGAPPRGIGKVTLLKILEGKAAGTKADAFLAQLQKIKEASQKLAPSELIKYVIRESGQEAAYKKDKLEGPERLLNLRELVSLATRYDGQPVPSGVEAFLESAVLASDQDELKEGKNTVRLMTVHASKGLEFPVVFITGLEEGLFPYDKQDDEEVDKEEERRLMYVAITRAQEKVYLTYASYRTVFGSKNPTLPSQFLSDVPGELLQNEMPALPAGRQGGLGKTIYLD